ncbi:MAG TPA: glycoside hydrolase family 15 protein [Candidatus Ozemobacteraceae bacterium]|nr:glycoside hydrolase family 15 protein [Candidatus Ozemobacteraceae bacterium]
MIVRKLWLGAISLMLVLCLGFSADAATRDEAHEAALSLRRTVLERESCRVELAPEGQFITVFNDVVGRWVRSELTPELLRGIRSTLAPHLQIRLNARGFAPAAARDTAGKPDATNYDAIWVRDNVWVFYALAANSQHHTEARRLLLALWDYYATSEQIKRFDLIIADPARSLDQMTMPHIRFDGRDPRLGDVRVNGQPEIWNHRQIDAHGLFFTALGESFLNGLLQPEDLTRERMKVLARYPLFLRRISFDTYEDAGAWEEVPRRNTSSIALATRSLQVWKRLLYKEPAGMQRVRSRFRLLADQMPGLAVEEWGVSCLDELIDRGLKRVRHQLRLGGESPDYEPTDLRYRRADAALLVLIQPSPLEGLTEAELRQVLQIVETLERPAGILRYVNDSYQGGNYWITPEEESTEGPTLTGDTSSDEAFRARLAKLPPHSEAQWFFDSLCALARLHLAEITRDPRMRRHDLHQAAIHLKRSLGQVTGSNFAADGAPVDAWQTPESINTVELGGRHILLPSPITPLNWAKAGLDMALRRYAQVAFGAAD